MISDLYNLPNYYSALLINLDDKKSRLFTNHISLNLFDKPSMAYYKDAIDSDLHFFDVSYDAHFKINNSKKPFSKDQLTQLIKTAQDGLAGKINRTMEK